MWVLILRTWYSVTFWMPKEVFDHNSIKNSDSPNFEKRISKWYYEGCSNMNASSFITFFTYMLRQNVIPFLKELFVAFIMVPNIKKHSLYFSSYRPKYKGHSCILKFFWSKLQCTFQYMCDIVLYLCKF